MDKDIVAIVDETLAALRHAGYAECTVRKGFGEHYRRLIRFANSRGERFLTEELARDFLDETASTRQGTAIRVTRRALAVICAQAGIETDAFSPDAYSPGKVYVVPEKLALGLEVFDGLASSASLKTSTLVREEYTVRKFLLFLGGRIDDLRDLSVADLDAYAGWLAESSKPGTVIREMGIVRKLVSGLVDEGIVGPDVLRLAPDLPRRPKPEIGRILTADEMSRLLAAAAGRPAHPLRALAVLGLLSQYMLRSSDVAFMEVGDIRWREGTIVLKSRKTARERVFPLSADMRYILLDYLKNERPETGSSRMFMSCKHPFPDLKSPDAVASIVKKAARDAGLDRPEEVSPHTIRRSGATMLVNSNVDYATISEMLIHVTSGTYCSGTTMRYLDIHTERLRSVAMEVKPRV